MDVKLQPIVEDFKRKLAAAQIRCVREKDINYGHQVVCAQGTAEGTVNFYYGKKGLSVVVQGKDGALKQTLTALTTGEKAADPAAAPLYSAEGLHPQGISCWMGCDESGKGDVFGPLVAAACLIQADEEAPLRRLGVCDSKMLTDDAIARLAAEIREMLGDRCVVSVLMPEEYNARYQAFKQRRKNLNHLLGSIHGHNIRVLLSKYECPCIIVDKFGKEEYVLAELQDEASSHQIIQVTKGERDTAVAAASILARQAFVDAMARLARQYGMTFPKGAYMGIASAIAAFRKTYGDGELSSVGKLNFKNFDFLR